jgi:hypothetical protein
MRKTRVNGVMLAIALALIAEACGNSSASPPVATVPTPVPRVVTLVTGSVYDTASRRLAGAGVEIVDGPHAGASVTTDTAGRYSLSGTFVGAVTLRATKEGYLTATQTLDFRSICSDCTAEIYFRLQLPENVKIETGSYTLTWIADSACTDIPEDVRTRTYGATITAWTGTVPGYSVNASGLVPGSSGFGIAIAGNYLQIEIDEGLREEIPPGTSIAFYGFAGVSVETSPVSTLSFFPINGVVDYCVLKSKTSSSYECGPPDEVLTHSRCRSMNHRMILTRR